MSIFVVSVAACVAECCGVLRCVYTRYTCIHIYGNISMATYHICCSVCCSVRCSACCRVCCSVYIHDTHIYIYVATYHIFAKSHMLKSISVVSVAGYVAECVAVCTYTIHIYTYIWQHIISSLSLIC